MAKLIEITGKAISGEWGNDDESGTGIPVLRTTNFTNSGIIDYSKVVTRDIKKKNLESKYLRYGDIIIEKSGGSDTQPVGRVVFFEGEENKYLFNNFTGLLRVADHSVCFPKYLFYFLYYNYQRGGTIPFQNKTTGLHNLKTDDYVSRCEVPLPPLETQKQIAATLDKATHTIDLCNAILEKLDLLVKARFVEMFCISDEWEYVHIKDICTDMRTGPFGSALHHDEFVDEGIFVLGIDNAVENKFSYNRMRYITEEKYQQLKRYTVKPLDVIITIMGTVGRSAVIPPNIPLAINTKHLACLTLNMKIANPFFIAKAFQIHPELLSQLTTNSKGAIMDGLNLTIIKGLKFRLPPIELQEQFAALVEKTERTKAAVKQVLAKAETLKKALMQEYFG